MPLVTVSLVLIVLANVLYHVSQKSIARTAPPVLSLLVTYGIALVGTLLLIPLFPVRGSLKEGWRQLNWASAAVGVAALLIELGFLLAYRAGLKVSLGSAVAGAAVAALLVPTGLLFFGERLSATNVVGVFLCAIGLYLALR